jgi:virginiamycin B lyase
MKKSKRYFTENGIPMLRTCHCLLAWALALGASSLATAAQPDLPDLLDITEWEVPWGGRPRDPYVSPDGGVWFCGQGGNYLARFDPASGKFNRYDAPLSAYPHNLIVDARGFVWYAGNRDAHIGRLNPATGKITQYPTPKPVIDPHTLVFNQAGNIWFTAQKSNAIGLLDTASGRIRVVMLETPQSRPYGIKTDSHNRPWVALLGTNRLATVDPQNFALDEIELPVASMRPRRLEIDRDDAIWYVDYASGYLGRYDPGTRNNRYWRMPGGKHSRPYGTALDDSGILWIAETGDYPNRLIGFDTARQEFISASPVASGGSIRHMYSDDQADAIWFGVDSGFIARARRR